MLTPHSTIQRAPDLLATEVDGDLVMLSLRTNKYYGMEVTGSRIWALIEQPTTPEGVIAALMAEYAIDRETCERDTMKFLNDLLKEQLLDVQA
ncbi:MAG: lasso peptide biosynthesis PqqD family chaperone [Chloroflexota bacterium]|nr:lasso peptide biosynthesis PqqD family chaperone [Chloroflexota bacterium]